MADSQSNRESDRISKICPVCGKSFTAEKPSRLAKRKVCSRTCSTLYQQGGNNPHWKGGLVKVACNRCGKTKTVYPCLKDKVHYCSRECLALTQSEEFKGENGPRWNGGPKPKIKAIRHREHSPQKHLKKCRICKKCGETGVRKGCTYHPKCSPRQTRKYVNVLCKGCGIERRLYPRDGVVPKRCMACEAKRRKGKGNGNWKGGITPKNEKIRHSDRYKEWRKTVFERDQFTCVWCGQVGGTLHADHIKPFAKHPRLRFEVSNGRTLCVACHKKTPSYLSKGKKRPPKLNQLDFRF